MALLVCHQAHHDVRHRLFCVIIPSIILHEISHGWVALAFGDDTAKRAGRLTLNPIAHVDPVGTLLVPASGPLGLRVLRLGQARPGQPGQAAQPAQPGGRGLAGRAGHQPVAAPAVFAVLFRASGAADAIPVQGPLPIWVQVLFYAGIVNIWLACFNLIPIPPLDGSVLVERLLPRSWWPAYLRIRPYTLPVLLVVVVLASTVHVNLFGSFETTTSTGGRRARAGLRHDLVAGPGDRALRGEQPDRVGRPRVGGGGHLVGLVGPLGQHGVGRRRVARQLGVALPDGSSSSTSALGQVASSGRRSGRSVAATSSGRRPVAATEDLEEVGQAGLGLGVVADLAVGVGDGATHLALDLLGRVEDADRAERGVDRLGHLALGVLEVHHPGATAGMAASGTVKISP